MFKDRAERTLKLNLSAEGRPYSRKDILWQKEWGGVCFWSFGGNKTRGNAIMFRGGLFFERQMLYYDAVGQGCPTGGPRAASGPRRKLIRPAKQS